MKTPGVVGRGFCRASTTAVMSLPDSSAGASPYHARRFHTRCQPVSVRTASISNRTMRRGTATLGRTTKELSNRQRRRNPRSGWRGSPGRGWVDGSRLELPAQRVSGQGGTGPAVTPRYDNTVGVARAVLADGCRQQGELRPAAGANSRAQAQGKGHYRLAGATQFLPRQVILCAVTICACC